MLLLLLPALKTKVFAVTSKREFMTRLNIKSTPDFETTQIGGDDVVVVYKREAVKKAKAKYPNHILYSHLEVDALKDCTAEEIDLLHFTKKTFDGAIYDEKTAIRHHIIKKRS